MVLILTLLYPSVALENTMDRIVDYILSRDTEVGII